MPFRASGESALRPFRADPSDHRSETRFFLLPDDQARDPAPFDPRIEARHRFHTMATWQLRVPANHEKRQRGCAPRLSSLCATGVKHPKVSRRLYLACDGLRRAVPSRLVAEPLVSRMKTAGRVGARLFEHRAPRPTLWCSPAKGCTFLWTEELSTAGTRRQKGLLPGSLGRPSS